jgi:chromosome segregation ATPase
VSLSRGLSLAPLGNAAPVPLTRDERTQLIAAKLSAEAEADEIKQRSAQLYQQNVDLTNQVQTLTLQRREANGTIKELTRDLEACRTELDTKTAELADALDEVQRLTTLATFAPSSPTPVPSFAPPGDAPLDG